MATLSCDEVREALWPDPGAASASPALAHFQACPDCQAFFAIQAQLGRRLAAVNRPVAPGVTAARIRRAVRGARGRWARWIAMAAAAAIALMLFPRKHDPAMDLGPVATELAQASASSSMDRNQASGWLSEQLAMPLTLPEITGAAFMGAKVVPMHGGMMAAARYDYRGMPMAYFAMAAGGSSDDSSMRMVQAGVWQIAVWTEPSGMRALAGQPPLTADDVMAMAHDCRAASLQSTAMGSPSSYYVQAGILQRRFRRLARDAASNASDTHGASRSTSSRASAGSS